jgi:hypothetical protein
LGAAGTVSEKHPQWQIDDFSWLFGILFRKSKLWQRCTTGSRIVKGDLDDLEAPIFDGDSSESLISMFSRLYTDTLSPISELELGALWCESTLPLVDPPCVR